MPTPVGPAPRDPDDPDLWEEWYQDDDQAMASRRGWPVRLLALVAAVGIVALLVLGR
jgi:hypothetical protein